jgi:hypothetical protein
MKKVKAVEDNDGHWYLIPNELYNDFFKDMHDDELCDSGRFDEKYRIYRTGGNLNLIQLYIE